jgi:hypothetical protein
MLLGVCACAEAPVDSITTSAPSSSHGSRAGSVSDSLAVHDECAVARLDASGNGP